MLDKLQNLENNFKAMRNITLVSIVASLIVCVFSLIYAFNTFKNVEDRLYVLNENQIMEAQISTRSQNLEAEIIGHVSSFHKTFFDWDPDKKQIEATVEKSLFMADESAMKLYKSMKDNGFVTLVVGSNVVQRTIVDSVKVGGNRDRPIFQFFGRQRLIKNKSSLMKNLITQGDIQLVKRTSNNPHGMIIRNLSIIENKEISRRNLY